MTNSLTAAVLIGVVRIKAIDSRATRSAQLDVIIIGLTFTIVSPKYGVVVLFSSALVVQVGGSDQLDAVLFMACAFSAVLYCSCPHQRHL